MQINGLFEVKSIYKSTPHPSNTPDNVKQRPHSVSIRQFLQKQQNSVFRSPANNFASTKEKNNSYAKATTTKSMRPKSSVLTRDQYQLFENIKNNQIHTNFQLEGKRRVISSSRPVRSVKKNSTTNVNPQLNKKQQFKIQYTLSQEEPALQKSTSKPTKTLSSTKNIGIVKAYGVNSHRFFINPCKPSEARICIVANLTKTVIKQQTISFYCLFQSQKSSVYIDFLRQNLPNEMSLQFTNQLPKQGIISLQKVQRKFCEFYRLSKPSPRKIIPEINLNRDISYGIVFARGKQLTVIAKGITTVNISESYGSKLIKISGTTIPRIKYFSVNQTPHIDYIAITSHGIVNDTILHSNSTGWIHRQVWLSVLSQLSSTSTSTLSEDPFALSHQEIANKITIHEMIQRSVEKIMNIFTSSLSCFNISMILLGFLNMQKLIYNYECEKQQFKKYEEEGRQFWSMVSGRTNYTLQSSTDKNLLINTSPRKYNNAYQQQRNKTPIANNLNSNNSELVVSPLNTSPNRPNSNRNQGKDQVLGDMLELPYTNSWTAPLNVNRNVVSIEQQQQVFSQDKAINIIQNQQKCNEQQ